MRRLTFRINFFCLVLCGSVLLPPAQAQQTEKAELTDFSGNVQVLLQGAEDYTDAQEGMELESGDKIKTESSGSAELSFNQDNTNLVRLSENTSAEISLSGDEKLKMSQGEVFASISSLPSGSAFEIRTPTAVSGARGTDWVTKVTDEGTDVEAIESQPYVRHYETSGKLASELTFITPGQMTTVRKFQRPMAFRPIAEVRRQQWQLLKIDIRRRAREAIQRRQQRQPFNRNEFLRKIKERRNLSLFKPLQTGQEDNRDRFKTLFSREREKVTSPQEATSEERERGIINLINERIEQLRSAEEKAVNLDNQTQQTRSDNKGRLPLRNIGGFGRKSSGRR